MSEIIKITIKGSQVSVNDDKFLSFKPNELLLNYYYEGDISSYKLKRLGKSIYDEIFSNEYREKLLEKNERFPKVFAKNSDIELERKG